MLTRILQVREYSGRYGIAMQPKADGLVQSIHGVIAALTTHQPGREATKNSAPDSQAGLIASIRDTAIASEKARPIDPLEAHSHQGDELIQNICAVSSLAIQGESVDIDLPENLSILSLIGHGRTENTHSDFLAALLRSSTTGEFAFRLFEAICESISSDRVAPGGAFQAAHREVVLAHLDPRLEGSEIGKRRIDVLVERENSILVIENKVDSGELENQTRDYRDAVERAYGKKQRFFVFLTPDGRPADCPSFKGVSHLTLFRCIRRASSASSPVHPLVSFYMEEMAHTLVRPAVESMRRSLSILRRHGHER